MEEKNAIITVHPMGELKKRAVSRIPLETLGGRLHMEWDDKAAVTPMGLLPHFADFLKTADLFDPWVSECPLHYTSPNAPAVRDILGTIVLSVLAGQNRYTHITSLRSDEVTAKVMGMGKICSEDSVRRAFQEQDSEAIAGWMRAHLRRVWAPLVCEPWILDVDTTVKPLYGRSQEGAVVGYNPEKPGRPSHACHTYFMASTRIVLDVEVQPGNQTASRFSAPGLFAFIDGLNPAQRPGLIRGDSGFGNEWVLSQAEARGQGYLFKLRLTSGARKLIESLFYEADWRMAGQGWESVESRLCLSGWSRKRRVVVLRRRIRDNVAAQNPADGEVMLLDVKGAPGSLYEYAVLAVSEGLAEEVVAQLYRDRADCENVFDELKNQWGWRGYVTQDLARCRLMARAVALVYNWWTLFAGLAIGDRHIEAVTSRPLLLYAVGRQTTHGGQSTLFVTSMHGKGETVRDTMAGIAEFLIGIRTTAEQLSREERWRIILSRIFARFLRGRPLGTTPQALVFQS